MDRSMPDFEQDRMFKRWEKLHLEQLAVLERWKTTGLCKGLDDYPALQVAYLMENQRLFNENDKGIAWFKRISIPLVRRAYSPDSFIGWYIVGVQALHGPVGLVKSLHHGRPVYHEITAKTRALKCRLFDNDFEYKEGDANILDKESTNVLDITKKVATDMNQEVLTDLHKNASHATTIAWKPGVGDEEIWPVIKHLRETIRDKSGMLPNWLVTTPEVAAVLKAQVPMTPIEHDPEWGVVRTAMLDDELLLIENRETKSNDCILGYKGGQYGSQYLYCPYIPFTATPVVLDKENFNPSRGVLKRYGKKLLSTADNYYGVLRIEEPK